MPKEETVEMRKVRTVQGELEDLPNLSPRATQASRVRALQLASQGLPQLVHEYGAIGLDTFMLLDYDRVEGFASDGYYLYVTTRDDGAFVLGSVTKIDLATFTIYDAIGFTDFYPTGIVLAGDYIYVATKTIPTKIHKIRRADFTLVDTLTLNAGEDECEDIYSDGTYLYAATWLSPAKIVRINLDDFTREDVLTLNAGENEAFQFASDGTYLYVGLYTNPGKVVKIDMTDFTRVDAITFNVGETSTLSLLVEGDYLYAGTYELNGKLIKVDLKGFRRVDSIVFGAGESYITDLCSDGVFLYGACYVAAGYVTKVDLATFRQVGTLQPGPGGVGTCTALFFDGTYLYTGLGSVPGVVLRSYVIPVSGSLQGRRVDRLYERQIDQSMPLAMYGAVTTYTDPTHFIVSALSGFGDHFFDNWFVYVTRDPAGVAPQSEKVKISGYASATGTFTHAAFTAILAVDDEVLILHPDIGGGDGGESLYGGKEIWESFEYPSDATLQTRWIEGGDAGNPTRSVTSYWGQYAMQTIMVGTATGYLYHLLTSRNMNPIANITIAARSGLAGDTFQFTLYDSLGNYSYWTQTCPLADTWYNFEINIHSVPTGSSATPVDLEDVVEIRLAELDPTLAGSTYLFDLITFEGLATDDLEDILEKVNQIFDLENAELVLSETGGTLTTDGTVQTLYINDAPAGVFKPRYIQLDFTNHTAAETVVVREWYRISPAVGAALIEEDVVVFAGLQSPLIKTIELTPNRFGAEVTIEKTVGGNQAYIWEVFYEA